MIQVLLSNRQRPDMPPVPVCFPIAECAAIYENLNAIGIGHIAIRDCFVKELGGEYPILKRLLETEINVDELDYLAKRLESFDKYELAQFQGAAVSQDIFDMTDFINLTFCCQGVTVVQDFTNLTAVGRKHYMNLQGGLTEEDIRTVDFQKTALALLLNEKGTVTLYGVVYENGMELDPHYDGLYFPAYQYSGDTVLTIAATDRSLPEDTRDITACNESNDKPSNQSLMELYALVGRCIYRQGEKAFVAHLAETLAIQFPSLKGFSLRNLRRMRDFYRTYANDPVLMEKAQSLSWTQNAVILECCDIDEQRSFYICLATAQNLSKLALRKAIEENAFDALSEIEGSLAEYAEPCVAPVRNILPDTGEDTTAIVETACEPSVPVCEPLRQGVDMPCSDGRLSAAVSAEVSIGRQAKHKANGVELLPTLINPHQPYPPIPIMRTDHLKLPKKPPPDILRSQKKNPFLHGKHKAKSGRGHRSRNRPQHRIILIRPRVA